MSLTLAKLQQLKRQTGCSAPPLAHTLHGGSTSIEQLRVLLRLRAPAVHRSPSTDRSLPGVEIAPGLHLREMHLPDDVVPDQFDGTFDRKEALQAKDLLFFDTETTGLAGGTGTRAFMIGAADWNEGRLRVRQLTISTITAEVPMLERSAHG